MGLMLTFIAAVGWIIAADSAPAAERLRIAYPAVAPGSTPSWVTAEKGLWRKYGFDVEPILVSSGARAVPALVGQSVQFLVGSDTGVTTAMLQGIPSRTGLARGARIHRFPLRDGGTGRSAGGKIHRSGFIDQLYKN
jgi:ABC-type nitrate/sulfonate/bicarbonate transport system substrate-binding protein